MQYRLKKPGGAGVKLFQAIKDVNQGCSVDAARMPRDESISTHDRANGMSDNANCSVRARGAKMIFSEINSTYYNTVSHILSEAVSSPVSMERIREIALKYGFAESVIPIESAIREQNWQLILPEGSTPLRHKPDIPLTELQLRC